MARRLDGGDQRWEALGSVRTHPAGDGNRLRDPHPPSGRERTRSFPQPNVDRTGTHQGLDFTKHTHTHTHPALLQLTHKHTRTHSTSKNHEAPLLELSVTAALMAFWIKYGFLKVNGSTWMCLISNVDYFISENCILWRKYKSIYEIWFCLVDRIDRLVFTSGSCHAQSCHRLSSCCCQWWVELRANSTSTPCFASVSPPPANLITCHINLPVVEWGEPAILESRGNRVHRTPTTT